MTEHLLISLGSIFIIGIGAQWLAWRLELPSILLLLIAGFVAGPLTGLLDPDELLGDMLFPLVSISVAIILFEGGMSLRFNELRGNGHVITNLVTMGVLITWCVCTVAAVMVLDMPLILSMLLGAILVVTGPTVIGPLLRVVRPSDQVGAILKWEGIVIDPIGASFALLMFEVVLAEELQSATVTIVEVIIRTIVAGGLLGALGAVLVVILLRHYWVPDFLQNLVVLMIVILVFIAAHLFQEESGLLAVTLMGILLTNQRRVIVKHILEFKENLRILLIGSLFVILTARLQLDDLIDLGFESLIFLAVLMLVARPLTVFLATRWSDLTLRESLFMSWVAPRGIVAASVASLFALRLEGAGIAGAEQIVPVTFLAIMGTVTIYSLTALPVARLLGVTRKNPQGVLIVGARSLARIIGHVLQEHKYQVLLIDANYAICEESRAAGLPTIHGSILSEEVREEIDLGNIGRLLAMTANDEVNTLACREWSDVFGKSEIYQLPTEDIIKTIQVAAPPYLRGRPLFGHGLNYAYMADRLAQGDQIVTTEISHAISLSTAQYPPDETKLPLFVIDNDGDLIVLTAGRHIDLKPGQKLISLVSASALQVPAPAGTADAP